jgi:hypothetical protein
MMSIAAYTVETQPVEMKRIAVVVILIVCNLSYDLGRSQYHLAVTLVDARIKAASPRYREVVLTVSKQLIRNGALRGERSS